MIARCCLLYFYVWSSLSFALLSSGRPVHIKIGCSFGYPTHKPDGEDFWTCDVSDLGGTT
jgi:hypothetical protein